MEVSLSLEICRQLKANDSPQERDEDDYFWGSHCNPVQCEEGINLCDCPQEPTKHPSLEELSADLEKEFGQISTNNLSWVDIARRAGFKEGFSSIQALANLNLMLRRSR